MSLALITPETIKTPSPEITGVGIIITVWELRDKVIFVVENTSKRWKLQWQKSIPFETMEIWENPAQTASRWVDEELGISINIEDFSVLWEFSLYVKSAIKHTKIAVVIVHAHVEDISIDNKPCDEILEKWIIDIWDLLALWDSEIRPCVKEAFALHRGETVWDITIGDLTSR